jgi:Family of unknown function (DUF5368)
MKDLDLSVFLSVFQEMLGPFMWVLFAVAVVGLAAFAYVLIRDRGLSSRRFLLAEIAGVIGGFVALSIMWSVTHSGLSDIGGPIDWVLVAVIWIVGGLGGGVLAYAAQGLLARNTVS